MRCPAARKTLIPLVRRLSATPSTSTPIPTARTIRPRPFKSDGCSRRSKPCYFEEPCPFDHLEDTKSWRTPSPFRSPAASRSTATGVSGWMIGNHGVDIVQPDLHYYGGMVRSIRVARMAEAAKMPTTVHISGGFGFVYMLHFASCVRDIAATRNTNSARRSTATGSNPPLSVKDGKMSVPSGPGVASKTPRLLEGRRKPEGTGATAADRVSCCVGRLHRPPSRSLSFLWISSMIRTILTLILIASSAFAAGRRAKNVILFLGDAGGIRPSMRPACTSTIIHRSSSSRACRTSPYRHLGRRRLGDDSAAACRHRDGPEDQQRRDFAVRFRRSRQAGWRGTPDDPRTREQRGLSTGVLTNMAITDATAAACYAHSNDRSRAGEIFAQVLRPRFGDGVDVLIGAGRNACLNPRQAGPPDRLRAARKGLRRVRFAAAVSDQDQRVAALFNTSNFDVSDAVRRPFASWRKTVRVFSDVEWDVHTDNIAGDSNR